jgi:hypothetical protein
MKTCGGVEVNHTFLISIPDEVSCQCHTLKTALWGKNPGTHWIGILMFPRSNMDMVAKTKKKISVPGQD